MDPYILEATAFTPKVVLDPVTNKFEISGESRPENAGKFYDPIYKWFEQYKALLFWQKDKYGKSNKVVVEFSFDYFNSSSTKYILDILTLIDSFRAEGFDSLVKWHYYMDDEDMRDSGEEFSKLINVPFEFVVRD